jgi:hypothetical protein
MAPPEDSAHAIFTIIAASAVATGKLRKGYDAHCSPWYHTRVLCTFRPNSNCDLRIPFRHMCSFVRSTLGVPYRLNSGDGKPGTKFSKATPF